MKMMEKIQTKQNESEKKMELMATTLQTLIRDTATKATNTWKGNYQNKDKEDNDSISKEVHVVEHYTKHTPIDKIYNQTLECLLYKRYGQRPLNQARDGKYIKVKELRAQQVLQESISKRP